MELYVYVAVALFALDVIYKLTCLHSGLSGRPAFEVAVDLVCSTGMVVCGIVVLHS